MSYTSSGSGWAKGINDSKASDEEVAADVIKRFQGAWGQISDVRANHVKWLKAFYGMADDLPAYKKNTGASNMFVPLIEPLTDTIIAKVFLTILSFNPFIRFESESSDKQDVLAARCLERAVKYLVSERIPGAKDQLYLWLQDAGLFGQGFLHVYFDTVSHTRNSVEIVPNPIDTRIPMFDATGQPITAEIVSDVIDYTGLKFEIIDINNIALDWSTADWRKSWIIVRERIDPETYLERVKNSGYKDLDDDELSRICASEAEFDDIQIEVDGKSGTTTAGVDDDRKKIELYHYYGKGYVPYYDKDGNVIDKIRQDCKMVVAGRKQRNGNSLIVVPPIPFGVKPIVMMRFKPKRGEALGRGIGAQIYDLQAELNVTRNQRMDAINFNLNQGFIVSPGAVENEDDLNSRNGQVIHKTDPMGVVEPIQRAQIPIEAWKHEEEIKADAQLVTSSADILRGGMERKETAFTANLRNSNAGQRLEAVVFRMADGLRELAEVIRGLLAEFTPTNNPVIVKLTQDEAEKYAAELGELYDPNSRILTITPDILKRTMFAIPCISALDGDNQAKSQMLLQMMQILQPYLQINPQTGMPMGWKDRAQNTVVPDIGYLIREYSRLNKTELKDMLITIPAAQVQAAQQQVLQQQMALQQAKGGATQPQEVPNNPGEIAGQSMLTSPQESANQQMGIEDMLLNS